MFATTDTPEQQLINIKTALNDPDIGRINVIDNFYTNPPNTNPKFIEFIDKYDQVIKSGLNVNEMIAMYPRDTFSQTIMDYIIVQNADTLDILKYMRDYYKEIYTNLKKQIQNTDTYVIKNLEKNNKSLEKKQKILQDQINKLNK